MDPQVDPLVGEPRCVCPWVDLKHSVSPQVLLFLQKKKEESPPEAQVSQERGEGRGERGERGETPEELETFTVHFDNRSSSKEEGTAAPSPTPPSLPPCYTPPHPSLAHPPSGCGGVLWFY